jgi:hypothetical protein
VVAAVHWAWGGWAWHSKREPPHRHPTTAARRHAHHHAPHSRTQILEAKVRKLEQLVKLKDTKINTLLAKLQAAGLA